MRNLFILFFLIFSCHVSLAQSVTGKWKTFDIFNSSRAESIVEISVVNEKMYVIISEIIPEDHKNDLCIKCTDHRKDEPILGMVILNGATLKKGVWQGVKVLNAKNGKEYGCHISLAAPDLLRVRGFIGYPIFGKTLYWTRVEENIFQ